MSLTSRFFKKPWQHASPDKRLAAVRDLDDPELIDALPELAEKDSASSVRLAALRRINSEAFWLDARLRESDPEILEAADRFLLRAVQRKCEGALEETRLQWFERIDSSEAIRTLARQAAAPALRRRALDRVQSQGFIGDCYLSEPDAELAAQLLERIDQASTLERLHQKLRKTSKSKAKAVMERIRTIESAQGRFDAGRVHAQQLLRQAEALARGENLQQRDSILPDLRQAWADLEKAPEDLEARFRGALSIIESAMARPSPGIGATASAPTETEAETIVQASAMQDVADAIRAELRQNRKKLKPQKLLADWDRAWNALSPAGPADVELKNEMLPILKELQLQVQRQAQSASIKAGATDGPERRQGAPDTTAMASGLEELAGYLEAGDLAAANRQRNRIRGQLHALPVRQRPSEISGRLQRLEGRLKEMRDYQHWSHNKHRDELIERIEALPGSGQHPYAISAALKEARAEWQRLEKLEILPGDKHKFAAPGGQWRRFQDACSAAFDSAKPYFEKRQSLQEETLERLERFIESGQSLVAEEATEPKELMPVLRKARQAIRRLDDLPPKARGPSAGRLRELMNAISERLDSAFEQVEASKRRLIDEASKLAQEGDLKAAIDRAKGLQAEWKRTGQGRRRIDQKLWKAFRAEIDPLFEQLDGERKQRQEADREIIRQIEALCEQAEALAEVADDELPGSGDRMRDLVERMDALSPRPPALAKRFERARHRLSDRQGALRKARQEQAARQIVDCVHSIQTAYADRLAGRPVDADALVPSTEQLPAGLKKAIEAVSDPSGDLEQLKLQAETNLEEARQIAVEFEFLSGLESPAEEKNRRMDFQVKRLAARMSEGDGQRDLGTELAELEERWYRSLPLPETQFEALQNRIGQCQSVIRKMMGIA
jgi:hypothetical protein